METNLPIPGRIELFIYLRVKVPHILPAWQRPPSPAHRPGIATSSPSTTSSLRDARLVEPAWSWGFLRPDLVNLVDLRQISQEISKVSKNTWYSWRGSGDHGCCPLHAENMQSLGFGFTSKQRNLKLSILNYIIGIHSLKIFWILLSTFGTTDGVSHCHVCSLEGTIRDSNMATESPLVRSTRP